MSPRENLLTTPSLPPHTTLPGAETRRRKARRRALEGVLATEANQEAKELQGSSDTEVSVVLAVTSTFPSLSLLSHLLSQSSGETDG